MDEDDLNTYRALLENSDDDERTLVVRRRALNIGTVGYNTYGWHLP